MKAMLPNKTAESAARQLSDRLKPQRLVASPQVPATLGANTMVLSAAEQRKADEEAHTGAKEAAELVKWLDDQLDELRIIEEAREEKRAEHATREISEELKRLVAASALLRLNSDNVLLALTPQDIADRNGIRGQFLRAALPPAQLNRAAADPGRFAVKLQTLIDVVVSPGQADLIWYRQAEATKLLSDSVQRLTGPQAHLWRLAPSPQGQRGRGIAD
jgi:hypothetical protein